MPDVWRAPGAHVSGPTAARSSRIAKDFHRRRPPDVAGHHQVARRGRPPNRSARAPADRTIRNGMRMLVPARLLCDLAWQRRRLDPRVRVRADARRQMLTSSAAARAAAKRFVAPGASGQPATGGDARIADCLVEAGRLRSRTPGVASAGVRPGCSSTGSSGSCSTRARWCISTFAEPTFKLAVEVDHVTWHGGRLDAQRDKLRDRELTRLGWTVVRVTDEDIDRRLRSPSIR